MGLLASLKTMLGAAPERPASYTPAAEAMHEAKRQVKGPERARQIRAAHAGTHSNKWRNIRWATLIFLNMVFVLSFQFDVQLVEGSLTASRVIGFHMADLYSAIQVMLAYKVILINLVIGTGTVFFLWWLFGGRTFCSWACPYHLLAEIAEKIHLMLAARRMVVDYPLHRGTRSVLYVIFGLLAVVSGYTVYESISPTGIVSRALIYGPGLAMVWVLGLLVYEVVFIRRMWCRYICPIGLTYGLVGAVSPMRVKYNLENCLHEGDCRKVCLVPHVLEVTKKTYAPDVDVAIGADCTRCGLCIDACPTGSLRFEVKGLNKLL
ncbi:NapH/MauN family ferredoxin-type protein [Magnetospirillum sp. SS-4]|uniref:NapH/MauN family ferredoxin-type protein n=1 Tax=Magnetospirillum sp. SS-4 TaxID=2681465 RepID=UPI0013817BB7|nr:NapH/MauN family ferredoxin-type protein [Magnetospirillum sp. SS-4]CAA7615523.1 Polyferredoxin [Magnetospirillum sp. SS-4]